MMGWAVIFLFAVLLAHLSGCMHESEPPTSKFPILDSIDSKSVAEGELLTFQVKGTHPSGLPVTLAAVDLPKSAVFEQAEKSAVFDQVTFSWTPSYHDAGEYSVRFTATTNGMSTSQTVKITVRDTIPAPMLNPIADKFLNESEKLTFKVTATSPIDSPIVILTHNKPGQGYLVDSIFTWYPTFLDSGTHTLQFIATSAGVSDTEAVKVEVGNVPISFARDVQPVFNGQCIECHSPPSTIGFSQTGGTVQNGLDLSAGNSWAKLVDAKSYQDPNTTPKFRVKPFDLNESYLIQKVDTSKRPKFGNKMPYFGGEVELYNLNLLKAWILEGALNN